MSLLQTYVALKIQKSALQFAQAALHEIELLQAAADGDPANTKCVVRLIDEFRHAGPNGQHLCMVLEFLGDSLLRLIKYNRYKGMGLDKVREICKCILTGLDYMHRELGIIHSDLKPENILLCSTIDPAKDPIRSGLTPILEKPEGNQNGTATMNIIEKKLKRRAKRAAAKISGRRVSIVGLSETPTKTKRSLNGIDMRCKVVDFGNACWADNKFAEEIQTRHYRAPEVILQSGYSFSVDMWSFACTAFELATGDMLFAPKEGNGYGEDEVKMVFKESQIDLTDEFFCFFLYQLFDTFLFSGLASGPPCSYDGSLRKNASKGTRKHLVSVSLLLGYSLFDTFDLIRLPLEVRDQRITLTDMAT